MRTLSHSGRVAHEALVVFTGKTELRCLFLLKRGFRHCFLVLRHDKGWVVLDPLSHRTDVSFLPPLEATELAQRYRRQSCRVLHQPFLGGPEARPRLRLALASCVVFVTRILGLEVGALCTPWKLYRSLRAAGWQELDATSFEEKKSNLGKNT